MKFKIKLTEGMKINFLQNDLTINIDTPASCAIRYSETDGELVFEKEGREYPSNYESCLGLLRRHEPETRLTENGLTGTVWHPRYEKQCAALYQLLVVHEAYTIGYDMDTYEEQRWAIRPFANRDGYSAAHLRGSKSMFVFPDRESCEKFIENFGDLLNNLRPLDKWVL